MSRIDSAYDTTFNLQTQVWPQPDYVPSLFSAHLHPPGTIQPRELIAFRPDWMTGILLLCLILIAWTHVFYHHRIRQLFKVPLSKRFMNQLIRDGNLLNERVSLSFGLVYLLTGSLLLYEINDRFGEDTWPGLQGFSLYLVFMAGLTGYWMIKIGLVSFLGKVFKTREISYQFLLNLMVFCFISGTVFLVCLVFILYVKTDVSPDVGIVVMAALFLFRVVRGFFIGAGLRKFSYLFLFVYLCSLEILPLVALAKLLINFMHS